MHTPPTHPVQVFQSLSQINQLAETLAQGNHALAVGGAGSSTALITGALAQLLSRTIILVVAHLDDVDQAQAELASCSVQTLSLPALEVLPGESQASPILIAERLHAMKLATTLDPDQSRIVICSIQSLMQSLPPLNQLDQLCCTLTLGQTIDPRKLLNWLGAAGYHRVDTIEEPGDLAVRGGIIDIFPAAATNASDSGSTAGIPLRLDFFDDELESIHEIDLDTMGSDRIINRVDLITADLQHAQGLATNSSTGDDPLCFLDLLPAGCISILADTPEVVEQGRGYYQRLTDSKGVLGPPAVFKKLQQRFAAHAEINHYATGSTFANQKAIELPIVPLLDLPEDVASSYRKLTELVDAQNTVCITCQNQGELQRHTELLAAHAPSVKTTTMSCFVNRGFIIKTDRSTTILPYHELLHRYETRRRTSRGIRSARAMDTFLDLEPGDYVVHADHGIALYEGLSTMRRTRKDTAVPTIAEARKGKRKSQGPIEEFLSLKFSGKSRLHVPAAQIDKVQKYVGGFKGKPPLSVLGSKKWQSQKNRVSESVRDLASELLRVRAARQHLPGIRYPADTLWQKEFEAEFPYQETEDQLASMAEIKRDMQSPRPMDRLLCGDVGFGKTELAIRAAFKVCESGRQVAVLVPTTVLAEQHAQTFSQRFADYPFKVKAISRFKTTKQINEVLEALKKGHVDLIIGTHRLLSKDVHFADLGLVVIDEEQRFGVEHKEKLLQMRLAADVLTLSATPIPRTLHMSMLGLRDISSLTTAPLDRQSVVTEVIPYNPKRIAQAIAREHARQGQVYFVHNRVYNIKSIADEVQKLAPDARIVIGHGQMPPRELEQVMLTFMQRKADILVATTIIESGIDNPTANTMFIMDADRFGLADLHQLRGRVGRHRHRAYCYLLLPLDRASGEKAKRRLKAMEQYSMLGAGFKIAMRDLEIRGAGNLLGTEQSGHIATVGYEMYCRLLDEAVNDLNNEPKARVASSITIDINMVGIIPKAYIPSDARRLEAYRRIACASDEKQLSAVRQDLTQAYSEPPSAAQRLLELAELRIAAIALGITSITIRENRDVVFRTAKPQIIADRLKESQGTVRILAPSSAPSTPAKNSTTQATPNTIPSEVYFRPPPAYLQPDTLLTVLRHRLMNKL